jgi:GNAT superfamily N-acetyltransferase
MTVADLPGLESSSRLSFVDLRRRLGQPAPPDPPAPSVAGRAIIRHLLELDASGAWVAEIDGAVAGVALAGRRERLWYLAQLHLLPGYQGLGIGRGLLAAALTYADGTAGQLLHSSLDPQAMRCYQRAGFALDTALEATGRLRRSAVPAVPHVRPGGVDDLDLAAHLDRHLRGGAHGPDLELLLRLDARMFVVDRPDARGYALAQDRRRIVAATDEATARALLWTVLAEGDTDADAEVQVLRADQQWAIDVAVRAGLSLAPTGPLCRRGAVGPLTPYLPHPALL